MIPQRADEGYLIVSFDETTFGFVSNAMLSGEIQLSFLNFWQCSSRAQGTRYGGELANFSRY